MKKTNKHLNHREKVRLARRMSGMQTRHFESSEWETRKASIAHRVAKKLGQVEEPKSKLVEQIGTIA